MSRLIVLILALTATGCSSNTPTAPAVHARQQVMLSPGQSVGITGSAYVLRFEGVEGDSRCPGDALCLTGGDAVVRVSVLTSTPRQEYALHTGNMRPFEYDAWTVSLVQLDPYPFSSLPQIQPGEYRATLLVTR